MKTKLYSFLTALVCAVLCVSVGSCGKDDNEEQPQTEEPGGNGGGSGGEITDERVLLLLSHELWYGLMEDRVAGFCFQDAHRMIHYDLSLTDPNMSGTYDCTSWELVYFEDETYADNEISLAGSDGGEQGWNFGKLRFLEDGRVMYFEGLGGSWIELKTDLTQQTFKERYYSGVEPIDPVIDPDDPVIDPDDPIIDPDDPVIDPDDPEDPVDPDPIVDPKSEAMNMFCHSPISYYYLTPYSGSGNASALTFSENGSCQLLGVMVSGRSRDYNYNSWEIMDKEDGDYTSGAITVTSFAGSTKTWTYSSLSQDEFGATSFYITIDGVLYWAK